MPIQIQVPGIGVAEFPDGVSYDDAFKAIQEDNPEWQPSRADIFSKMQSDSNAMASKDANRFLKQEGDSGLQVAYERMAGNVARGVGDILSAPVRLLEKPLDSYYAGERRAANRTGADMPVTFEQSVRSSFDESADAAETATQGRGNAALNFGADVVGGIAPTLAATALTGGLGGALFAGAQQFGSTRKRVLDYYKSLGLPDDDAQSTADMLGATSGVITGAVTKYTPEVLGKIPGIGKYIGGEGVEGMAKVLLTQRLRQTPVAEIARRAVGNSFGEATEESINQFLLEVVESKQLEPNLSWEEIAKRTAIAGAQGAAGGAGTSIVGDVSRAGVERLSGTTPQSEFEYLAKVGRFENAKRELDKNRAARTELDTIREQSANELAEMAGFEKPHTGQRLPLPEPQRFTLPTPPQAQLPTAIESEAVLLKQAEDARQAGQISDQEYLAAVDRFQQARAVNSAQPPPLPAPQTPNPLGGESTNEGQIQEKGLQVAPAVTPPPSSVAGEVVQPQSQPNTSNAVSIQSPNEGVLRQGGQELGLQSLVQGNPQSQVTAGTQAQEAQGGSATGLAAPIVSESKAVPEKRFKENRVVTPESLPDSATANNTEWFHGGKQGIVEPSSGFTAIDSLFGSGFYLTDDPEIANSYAKNRGGNKGALYSVKVNVGNVLNLETQITPDVANVLKSSIGDEFSSVVDKGAGKGDSTASVIRSIQDAFAEHSAENGIPKSEYVEYWQNIESGLREAGYDAMTHIGGTRAGRGKKLHQVLILLDPSAELARSDKPYNKTVGSIDRIDAALSRAIEATNPFGKANTGNLGVTYTVLKLTRAAYRAGKSLANAIRESIAQYRASNPAAQFNDDEVDAAVRIKLQDFLAGGEDALAIAKASEPAVAENERAAAMIHSEEYYRQRVRDKETELKKIRDDTLQAALGRGVDPSMVPGHMDEELANIADGVGLDAALITQLQTEVKSEKKAFVLSKLQSESEEINRTIDKLAKLDPDKNVQIVEDLLKRKESVDKEIADEKFDDVRIRAADILDFQREYVSRKARLEALNNPDVKEAISGPVQVLRDLMAEYPDIRDRGVSDWVSDPNITDEVKRVVVARLSTAFREFDKRHENVATTLAASEASLERQINRLKERISKGEIRKAYINIVIEEARLALAGEEGLTGGRGKEYLAWFDANTEALRSFARSIAEKIDGTGQSAMDARKLSDWLIFGPTSAPPAIVNSARENWGVGDETLREIMKALQESPAIRNAVAAIFDKGSETIPAHTLQKIAELANTGDESDWDEAERLSKSLQKKQGTERSKVIQRLRTDAKNLLDARLRLETLREALKLFQSVEASPVFKDARIETETQEGSFTRQMFVNDEVKMLLRGFESPGASHPEVQIGAASGGDQFFDKNTKSAIEGWRRSAGQYIAEYDAALLNSSVNPAAPHPISLGYDVAIYRGLKTALQESNILTDPSTYSDESKIDSWKGFTSLGQTAKFLQALDYTARMVEGVFGKNWQLKNARYRNAKLDAANVFHNRENAKIPALLSKAMASHKMSGADWLKKIPKFGPWFDATFAPGGNVEVYRNLVFDQIAHMARGNFVGSPQVGDTLPSGEVITQADLDLLDQAIRYSNGLLRVAQENRGTLLDINEKQYRRPAASVGVKGLARRIGKNAGADGGYVQKLASIDDPAGFDLSTNDDLLNGTRPWIKFWNEHAIISDALTRHVLDSVRGDRAVTVSPYMKKAYEGLAADLMVNKYANRISSLEDLVAKLSVHFPQGTGLSAREYVTGELGKELAQYAAHAKVRVDVGARIAQAVSPTTTVQSQKNKKDTLQKSSSMIDTETMNNEFTKPAADLEFPSSWYEYGAITPLEMALAKDRSVGEATVELKHAIREAKGFVSSFISANRGNKLMQDDVVRFENILKMINSIDEDVGVNYQPQINMAYRALKKSGGIAVGGFLTTVIGAAGNVLSSAYPAYVYHSRVNNVSRAMSAALALVHMGRATKNLAYVMIDKAVGGYASSAFKALAKSKNPKMVKVADTLTDWLDRSMKWAGFSAMVDVKDLGLSQTDRFLTEVANDFRSSLQYMDSVEEMKYSGVGGKALMAARAAGSAIETSINNFNKQIGLEMGDLAVNMAAYQIALAEERDLKKMAVKWASERVQKLGAFDESKPEWQARPDEWQGGYFQTKHAENEKLAGLRMQMSESGLQLENALWDYWNRSEGGKKDVEFFKDPDSFRRTTIGAINANIFTNRPQKAQTNPDQGMFQTLLNYSSNLLVQILSAFKSVKSAKGIRKWFDIIMRAVWGAIAALLVGLATSAGREVVGRNLTSRIDRRMTSYDKEFWTPDSKLPLRLAMAAMAVQPFGQSVVNIASMNRPDFASGNFYIGFINMLATYAQGATRAQVQDIPWLVDKFLHGIFKFLDVTDNMGVNATKQLNAGLAAASSAVHAAGLESQAVKSGASGFQFTEKTPILAKINEAGMRAQIAREKGDEAGLQAALADIAKEKDRLVKYHKDALIEDNKRRGVTMTDFKVDQESIAAARKDWLSLNPLTKALGHQPTSTEMERISAYLSGDRKAAFDRAWNSYSGLAEFFPNGKGVANEPEMVKQERIAGLGRSSGGLTGGMSAGSLSASLRGGGRSMGVRRSGLRSRRGRVSRLSRGVRSRRRSRGGTRGVRRIRF